MKILKWLGIVVVGLAVIIVVVAMQGAGDQRRMQSALQLTGGYVGMTEGQLYELGTSISKNGVGTIGEAREVIFWLVCSGRFSSATIEPSAKAALGLVSAQGLSEKEAVTTLIKMVDPSARAPLDGCPK